jgi:SagB-type dehydrogenase family enzyme
MIDTNESIMEFFHENTKHGSFFLNLGQIALAKKDRDLMARAFKTYEYAMERITLPGDFPEGKELLEEVIKKRRPAKEFSDSTLSLTELSRLLYFSYGIIDTDSKEVFETSGRVVPSTGGIYSLEIYLFIFNVKNLKKGIYHYNIKEHSLELLIPAADISERFFRDCLMKEDAKDVKKASIVLVITSMFGRLSRIYKERGYRYALFETGHLIQNTCLISTAMDLGVRIVPEFNDYAVENMLDIDGVHESVTQVLLIGKGGGKDD